MVPVFTVARAGLALYSAHEATGILGFGEWAGAVGRIVAKMALKVRRVDDSILQDMVRGAQQRVPQDTGRLYAGILGEVEDDVCVFSVSAQRETGGEDYAPFVEFGTRPGHRGSSVVTESLVGAGHGLSLSALTAEAPTRKRRQYREHPGTAAQPFFWPAVEEALARRGLAMSDLAASAAADEGAGDE